MINELNPRPILVLLPSDDCKNVLVGGVAVARSSVAIYDTLLDLFITDRRHLRLFIGPLLPPTTQSNNDSADSILNIKVE